MKTNIYFIGSCIGSPWKNAGYGVLIESGDSVRELSQGYKGTTSVRMELRALIAALKEVSPETPIVIKCSQQYMINAFKENWILKWQREGLKKIKNADLWFELLALTDGRDIQWVKVKASDLKKPKTLAQNAARNDCLLEDTRKSVYAS